MWYGQGWPDSRERLGNSGSCWQVPGAIVDALVVVVFLDLGSEMVNDIVSKSDYG